MARKYIKPFVFGLIGITQLMQCTMLGSALHMDAPHTYQAHSSSTQARPDQLMQPFSKLFCIDFDCLFQEGRKGLKNVGYLTEEMPCFAKSGDIDHDKYFTIRMPVSDEHIEELNDGSVFTIAQDNNNVNSKVKINAKELDGPLLEIIRHNLYDPKGFKELITNFLQKHYKVVVYASITSPSLIPIVLVHGIGLTQDQLSNICIVCNDYDVNKTSMPIYYMKHIQWAEYLLGMHHDEQRHVLIVSSLGPDLKFLLQSTADYVFMRFKPTCEYGFLVLPVSCWDNISKDRYRNVTLGSSWWGKISIFEEKRYALIQDNGEDKEARIQRNNILWGLAKGLQLEISCV